MMVSNTASITMYSSYSLPIHNCLSTVNEQLHWQKLIARDWLSSTARIQIQAYSAKFARGTLAWLDLASEMNQDHGKIKRTNKKIEHHIIQVTLNLPSNFNRKFIYSLIKKISLISYCLVLSFWSFLTSQSEWCPIQGGLVQQLAGGSWEGSWPWDLHNVAQLKVEMKTSFTGQNRLLVKMSYPNCLRKSQLEYSQIVDYLNW